MKSFRIGTLNVRGSREEYKIETVAKDAASYNIKVLGITETHLIESGTSSILGKSNIRKTKYNFFRGGIEKENIYSGVGVLIDSELDSKCERINDRICLCEIKLKENKTIYVIVAYAPTLKKSEVNPEIKENFYEALEKTVKSIKNRHSLFVIGDFNAKTGSGFRDYPEAMGRYGKGKLNSNGGYLLQFAKINNLYLTNTHFCHKMAHRVTWIAPESIQGRNHYDGTPRRNPYRNQIDYILTRNADKMLITDSRSYSGFETDTDHRMVIADIRMEWWRKETKRDISERINFEQDNNFQKINEYQRKIRETLVLNNSNNNPDKMWKNISEACIISAKETYGLIKNKRRKHQDVELEELSLKQKKLKQNIDSTRNKEKRKNMKKKRNKIMNNIKSRLKFLEDTKYEKELKEIEQKNDEQKCHAAVRLLKSKKPKKTLKVTNSKNQILTSEKDQVAEITTYFKTIFEKDYIEETYYPPCKIDQPFTAEEIEKSIRKLKNNKSAGPDNMVAETLKYAPNEVMEEIAKIFNISTESEDFANILREGILTPIQKPPNKKKRAVENLRPVTLLSVLRKVLATCMIERTWDRLKEAIPIEQAAYQKGRSTTEQVFTMKLLAEKAITTENYEIYIMLLDMSKAFDTVNRNKLMEYLNNILSPGEMRLIYLLISGVKLKVRIGKELGDSIQTNIGVVQGDCLSAILFIYYLAKSVKTFPKVTIREDHEGEALWSPLDWLIRKDKLNIEIDPKYSDDMAFIRSQRAKINMIKRIIPNMLKEADLIENSSKREEYIISRNSNDKWSTCKYLGSKLETKKDIERRKILSLDAMKTLEPIFRSRNISEKTKIRIFEAYVNSIFLYNCELWTLTTTLEKNIDSFQRRLMRTVLQIFWPKVINNEQLYEKAKITKWSESVLKRRLTWVGHLARLNDNTPARVALREYLKDIPKPVGRPKLTWARLVYNNFQQYSGLDLNYNSEKSFFNDLFPICADRKKWRNIVKHIMLQCATNMY